MTERAVDHIHVCSVHEFKLDLTQHNAFDEMNGWSFYFATSSTIPMHWIESPSIRTIEMSCVVKWCCCLLLIMWSSINFKTMLSTREGTYIVRTFLLSFFLSFLFPSSPSFFLSSSLFFFLPLLLSFFLSFLFPSFFLSFSSKSSSLLSYCKHFTYLEYPLPSSSFFFSPLLFYFFSSLLWPCPLVYSPTRPLSYFLPTHPPSFHPYIHSPQDNSRVPGILIKSIKIRHLH